MLLFGLGGRMSQLPVQETLLERSGSLGGWLGALGIGVMAQAVGLELALPFEVGAFVVAAFQLHRPGGQPRIA